MQIDGITPVMSVFQQCNVFLDISVECLQHDDWQLINGNKIALFW